MFATRFARTHAFGASQTRKTLTEIRGGITDAEMACTQIIHKREELTLRLYDVIWKDEFVEKIANKHSVTTDEVEEVLFLKPHVRLAEKGRVKGEYLYVAYGQTTAGRYLVVFFILKRRTAALQISARDMTQSERRYYDEQKKTR